MAGRPQRRAKLAGASSGETSYDRMKREFRERDPNYALLADARKIVGEVQWAFERLAQVAEQLPPAYRAVLMEAIEEDETSDSPEDWFKGSHTITMLWPENLDAGISNFEIELFYDEDEDEDEGDED